MTRRSPPDKEIVARSVAGAAISVKPRKKASHYSDRRPRDSYGLFGRKNTTERLGDCRSRAEIPTFDHEPREVVGAGTGNQARVNL